MTEASISSETPSTTSVDPLSLRHYRHEDLSKKQLKYEYPQAKTRKLKKFYTSQNDLIDQYLNSSDEERQEALAGAREGRRVKIAIYGSTGVNLCLLVVQLYAAASTDSMSLFATATDAFMDLISSITMFIASRRAKYSNIYEYPVGRNRVEILGALCFCALMFSVALQLFVESIRRLSTSEKDADTKDMKLLPILLIGVSIVSKFFLCCYCSTLRRHPAVHVFFIDHRNDLIVNGFGLLMAFLGDRAVWFLDPLGGLFIALFIIISWTLEAKAAATQLIGPSAPKEFLSKLTYVAMTHDDRVLKVGTVRAYSAGEKYYVEVNIVMAEDALLRQTHDVSQSLQRKLEGLGDVERAFVQVDYNDLHNVHDEHKPMVSKTTNRKSLRVVVVDTWHRIREILSSRSLHT